MAVSFTKVSNLVLVVLIVAGIIFVHYKFTNHAYEFSLPLNNIQFKVTETQKESGIGSIITKTVPKPILRMAFLKKIQTK